ncbi:TIM barrel protein [Candidatus Micrarchaeota archaeon]|nr:TIM barrel protein [Candidatus Micrarchaeota archaeon]
MVAAIRFGPAGIPIQCEGSSSREGVECCARLGLSAMELEFVQGVRMKDDSAREICLAAKERDVSLSSHAPYFVNLCTPDKVKLAASRRHILESARVTALAGGGITVFHPGFYLKLSPNEAFDAARRALLDIVSELETRNIKIRLGAETVGKRSAFGGLDENIRLSQDLGKTVVPAIDFAHLHARGDFRIRGEDDYRAIFGLLERELGDYVRSFHCHFSEINYSEKGELNHFPLGTNNEPPFRPFMKVLAESGYSGTVICETPKLDIDALTLMREYESAMGRKGAR